DVTERDAVAASQQMVSELLSVLTLFFCLSHEPVTHASEEQLVHLVAELGVGRCSRVLSGDLLVSLGAQHLVHLCLCPCMYFRAMRSDTDFKAFGDFAPRRLGQRKLENSKIIHPKTQVITRF